MQRKWKLMNRCGIFFAELRFVHERNKCVLSELSSLMQPQFLTICCIRSLCAYLQCTE